MINYNKVFSSFSVDDLVTAKKFYSETLGMEVNEMEMGLLELYTPGNNPILLYPKETHAPASFTVLNFHVENIDEAVDELTNRGVVFEQYNEPIKTDEKGICRGAPSIAWFCDPSGNILSVLQSEQRF